MRKLVIYLVIILFSFELKANEPSVYASIDTNNVLIGDQINLTLTAKSSKKIDFQFPDLKNTLNGLEIINKGKTDTTFSDTLFKISTNYIITSFDSGYYDIPSLSFTYLKNNSKETLYTEPLYLTFHTLEVDTTKEIKDIKPPLEVGPDWLEIFLYLIIAFAVLLLAYLVYKYYFKKKQFKSGEKPDYDETIPADIEALKRLKELEEKKLWQSGFHKEYFSELTDIIRAYMERQLNIDALEMTTSEILIALKTKRLSSDLIDKMQYLFENADLSKFAKYKPIPEININSLNYAYDFIEETKPKSENNKIATSQNDEEVKDNE